MLKPDALLRIFSELVLILLGLLLVQVAVSGRLFWNRRSLVWSGVGLYLVYWGLRAWLRGRGPIRHWAERLRGGSLAFIGVLMLAMARVPFDYVGPLLGVTGGVLIVRGAISAALLARCS